MPILYYFYIKVKMNITIFQFSKFQILKNSTINMYNTKINITNIKMYNTSILLYENKHI